MAGNVKAIPDGYHSVTPHLVCRDAAGAVQFYKKAFGAKELMRMPGPGGKLMHAELQIGDCRAMLCDEFPQMNARSPQSLGGSPVTLYLYVEDADAAVERAVAAGAKLLHPVKNQFYGDRCGGVEDPYGHIWNIATHVEDVSAEEIGRRIKCWEERR